MPIKYKCSLIAVSDLKESRYFYEQLLGQRVKSDYGENITFEGDFSLHLQSHYQQLIDGKEISSGGNNFELYFETDHLESIAENLENHSIEYVHELRVQPWRQKVLRIYDPDKHIVEIGESMEHLAYRLKNEGLTETEIATILTMPVSRIKQLIAIHTQEASIETAPIVGTEEAREYGIKYALQAAWMVFGLYEGSCILRECNGDIANGLLFYFSELFTAPHLILIGFLFLIFFLLGRSTTAKMIQQKISVLQATLRNATISYVAFNVLLGIVFITIYLTKQDPYPEMKQDIMLEYARFLFASLFAFTFAWCYVAYRVAKLRG